MKKHGGGVAFFDSGIGGLTVLDTCRKYLPDTTFYYYGDNAHAPYGNLSEKKIYRYTYKAFRLFKRLKVDAVVIACNTATAVCIERLRKRFKFSIIGTEPAVYTAASRGGEVFVLSTRATYESQRFKALCQKAQKRYPRATIMPFSCDALAGEIERHIGNRSYDFNSFLPRGRPNVVVLGCTHYIYIEEAVKKFYGCEVVNGNEGVATRLISVLYKSNFLTAKDAKLQEDRDERPHLTTKDKKGARKRLKVMSKTTKHIQNAQNYGNTFFLGKAQVVNKTQYEQMFATVITSKMGLSGQKS